MIAALAGSAIPPAVPDSLTFTSGADLPRDFPLKLCGAETKELRTSAPPAASDVAAPADVQISTCSDDRLHSSRTLAQRSGSPAAEGAESCIIEAQILLLLGKRHRMLRTVKGASAA